MQVPVTLWLLILSGGAGTVGSMYLFGVESFWPHAAMTASLGGIDALVFTAGIGERAAGLRSAICGRLEFVGVRLDEEANGRATPDAEISAEASTVCVWVLAAREDVVIARETRRLL